MKQRLNTLPQVPRRLFELRSLRCAAATVMTVCALVLAGTNAAAQSGGTTSAVPSIVLVHGAWADGSSWSAVIARLQQAGYTVTAVQVPLTALADDTARVRTVLAAQSGPTILVGHSFGGATSPGSAATPRMSPAWSTSRPSPRPRGNR